jgi:hypothetical protein
LTTASRLGALTGRLVCAALLLLPGISRAVITFERTWALDSGNDWCYVVEQLADGGYIIPTSVDGPVYMAFALIRVDSLGDTLWCKTYEPPPTGGGASGVCATLDGCFVLAGDKGGVGVSDAWAVKVDSLGDTVWTYTYDGPGYDVLSFVAATRDTGTIFSGVLSTGSSSGMALAKLTRDGELSWLKVYEPPNTSSGGASCLLTPDGGYVALGGLADSTGTGYLYLVRTDSIGDTVWTRTLEPLLNYPYPELGSMCATQDGGYAVCGTVTTSGYDVIAGFLLKVDSLGDSVWGRILFPDSVIHGQVYLRCVQATPDHGFVIAGDQQREGGDDPDTGWVLLVRLDSLGDTLWTRRFYGLDPLRFDVGFWVVNTTDGGFAIAGTADWRPAYLIKTDSLGMVYNAVSEAQPARTRGSQLFVNPSPFTDRTSIKYQVHAPGRVRISAVDVSGRMVATLLDADAAAGRSELVWSPENLAIGVYFIKLETPDAKVTQRALLVR